MTAEQYPRGVGPCEDLYRKLRDGHEVKDMTQLMEKIYDDWADQYEDGINSMGYNGPKYALQVLRELLPDKKDALVIDCGAGTGLIGQQFHSAGYRNVVGVDVSGECLKIAKSRNVYQRVFKCAVGKDRLPFEDNEADFLILVGAMGPTHIKAGALRDHFRVVKPGGYVVNIDRKEQLSTGTMVEEYEKEFAAIVDEYRKAGQIDVEERTLPDYVGGYAAAMHIFKML